MPDKNSTNPTEPTVAPETKTRGRKRAEGVIVKARVDELTHRRLMELRWSERAESVDDVISAALAVFAQRAVDEGRIQDV